MTNLLAIFRLKNAKWCKSAIQIEIGQKVLYQIYAKKYRILFSASKKKPIEQSFGVYFPFFR